MIISHFSNKPGCPIDNLQPEKKSTDGRSAVDTAQPNFHAAEVINPAKTERSKGNPLCLEFIWANSPPYSPPFSDDAITAASSLLQTMTEKKFNPQQDLGQC